MQEEKNDMKEQVKKVRICSTNLPFHFPKPENNRKVTYRKDLLEGEKYKKFLTFFKYLSDIGIRILDIHRILKKTGNFFFHSFKNNFYLSFVLYFF